MGRDSVSAMHSIPIHSVPQHLRCFSFRDAVPLSMGAVSMRSKLDASWWILETFRLSLPLLTPSSVVAVSGPDGVGMDSQSADSAKRRRTVSENVARSQFGLFCVEMGIPSAAVMSPKMSCTMNVFL